MTADDLRRGKADALLALAEAEEKLLLLRHRAETAATTLNGFILWLEQSPERNIFRSGQVNHGQTVEPTPQTYISALEPSQYFDLADEIRKTLKEIRGLTELKAKFRS